MAEDDSMRQKTRGGNRPLSEQVLTVGEYIDDGVHGGIASVLLSYRACLPSFRLIPSYRSPSLGDKLRYDLGSLFRLGWTLLKDRDIRIVHIHTAAGRSFTKHLLYARVARSLGRKVIMHCHASAFKDWFSGLGEARQQDVLRQICLLDKLIVLSASWKQYFMSLGVEEARIAILNNIVPHPVLPARKSSDGESLRLLFLGEIGPRKGVFDLLEALGRVRLDYRLDIGGNKMEKELEERIAALGLQGKVFFRGFVSGESKAELLSRADVFVLPSYNEGLPISILEAMSYGCAIVSTPVGGIPEVVDGNGILVAPGDIPALASALEALSDREKCMAMGRESLEKVCLFYPEAVMADLETIWQSV